MPIITPSKDPVYWFVDSPFISGVINLGEQTVATKNIVSDTNVSTLVGKIPKSAVTSASAADAGSVYKDKNGNVHMVTVDDVKPKPIVIKVDTK